VNEPEAPDPASSPDLTGELYEEPEQPARTVRHLRVVAPRPVVRVSLPELHEAIEATEAVLGHETWGDPLMFQRAHELVVVLGAPPELVGKKDRAPIVEETPIVRQLSAPAMTPRMCRFIEFQRFKEPSASAYDRANRRGEPEPDGWSRGAPPPQLIASLLACGEWPTIRRLAGVIETPSMRPDGTVLDKPGYDDATRTLYAPNADYPIVADTPTHAEAVLAYAKLRDVFVDFPYVHEAHRSATVAAVLTLLVRPAIRSSVPCWLFDASSARSGKSLQTDVISIIVTGRPASRCTYPENDEELEKVLSSYALAGVRIIPLDNVARQFGGAPLDKVITAVDTVDLRVLGVNEIRTLPWAAVILASGNNVRCRGDMLARVLSPRIESKLDNPELRTEFVHPERGDGDRLKEWTRQNRCDLVHAGLTVVRGFVAAGRPEQACSRWGGFDSWVRLVAHALVWVGAPDPMGARRGLADDDDPLRMAEAALVDGWGRLQGDDFRGVTIKGALAVLYPPRHSGDETPPDGLDDVRSAVEELTASKPGFHPTAKQLADALRRMKAKPVGGRKMAPGEMIHGSVRWRVVPA
jgi:putative DNA primase/helicase